MEIVGNEGYGIVGLQRGQSFVVEIEFPREHSNEDVSVNLKQ